MAATVHALRPAPKALPAAPAYVSLSAEAREAMAALDGKMAALRRIFSGSFTTNHQAADIERLTIEIGVQARLVWRLSR